MGHSGRGSIMGEEWGECLLTGGWSQSLSTPPPEKYVPWEAGVRVFLVGGY